MRISFGVTVAAASLMMIIVVGSAIHRIDRAEKNRVRHHYGASDGRPGDRPLPGHCK